MHFSDLMGQTAATLTQNKGRSALTVLGIVIGIASVIIMLSMGFGAQAAVQKQIASVGAQIVNVTVEDDKYEFTDGDVEALRRLLPNTEAVSGVLQSSGDVVWDGDSHVSTFYAADAYYGQVEGFTYVTGRYFTQEEQTQKAHVVLISKSLGEDLLGKENSAGMLGQTLNIEGTTYTVIGILDSQGSAGFSMGGTVYFPYDTFVAKIRHQDKVTVIAVRAKDTESIPALKPFILATLNARHGRPLDDDVFKASDLTAVLETASQVTAIFAYFLAGVAGISLLVGGIGIMNMMLTTVTERTREIGLRKAVGARRQHITLQFLAEAICLTFVGGFLGIVLGVSFSLLIGKLVPSFQPQITVSAIVLATFFSVSVGLFFGYYPARKAASLNPIEALRYE